MKIAMLTDAGQADEVTGVHMRSFEGFFLTFLGEGFLRCMYREFILHDRSAVIGAFNDNGMLIGFLAYSENISDLYKQLIRTQLLALAWYSLIAFLKRPGILIRLLRSFTYPRAAAAAEPYVELSSIGVLPDIEEKGVGTALLDELIRQVDFSKSAYIKLETDKLNNEKANHFYIKNGFVLHRSYTTPEGRMMNEYRYRKDGSDGH